MKESIEYTDIPIYGEFTPQGDIAVLKGATAIQNSLKYFLSGAIPDLFDLSKRGVLRKFINRPLNDATALDLKIAIETSITTEFVPQLSIQTLNVIPDYVNNEWELQLKAITVDDYLPIFLSEKISSLSGVM